MRKKDDVLKINVVLNPVFFNSANTVLDQYCDKNVVKRRRQFDNNYWALINVFQHVLYKQKLTPVEIEKFSKYGATIKLDNLHKISGMRKNVFLSLMKIFEEKQLIVPVRNENGNKSYCSGSEQYNSKSTTYYIPLQLILEMQKYEQQHGEVGECIEVEVSKKNVFYNEEIRKQKQRQKEEQMMLENKPVRIINGVQIYHNQQLLPWIEEEMNSPYKDFTKYPSTWEQIDIIRISDIEYDEEKFLEIAKKNNIQNPVEYLKRCTSSAMRTKLSHGRVVRYGWNHLKKYLREAVVYHGQCVDVGADYHNADFRMLVILAWIKREHYKIKKSQLECFEEDVKYGIYKRMDEWTNFKYGVDKVKELMLTFKNASNDSKRWLIGFNQNDLEAIKDIKNELLKHYPDLTKSMLMNYREIKDDGKFKNCLSVHCQNIEGYLMHQLILPVLEEKFIDPFTMCDAIWIRKSLATKENRKYIENIFEEQFEYLLEAVKHNSFIFVDKNDKLIYNELMRKVA